MHSGQNPQVDNWQLLLYSFHTVLGRWPYAQPWAILGAQIQTLCGKSAAQKASVGVEATKTLRLNSADDSQVIHLPHIGLGSVA